MSLHNQSRRLPVNPQSIPEAIVIAKDLQRSTLDREAAIHSLSQNSSPEALEALVSILRDDDFGIRWAAATGLAYAGEPALVPLLKEIVANGSDRDLRDAAHHALSQSVSPKVRSESQELQRAMKGPSADIATPEAAYKLLKKVTQ